MDEKHCQWCGTVSPADADRCVLCRLPLDRMIPPPIDWEPAAAVETDVETAAPEPRPVTPEPASRALLPEGPVTPEPAEGNPTWEAPSDPTYQLLAEHLARRADGEQGGPGHRRARRLLRTLLWLVVIGVVAAALVLAQGRLFS